LSHFSVDHCVEPLIAREASELGNEEHIFLGFAVAAALESKST